MLGLFFFLAKKIHNDVPFHFPPVRTKPSSGTAAFPCAESLIICFNMIFMSFGPALGDLEPSDCVVGDVLKLFGCDTRIVATWPMFSCDVGGGGAASDAARIDLGGAPFAGGGAFGERGSMLFRGESFSPLDTLFLGGVIRFLSLR